MGGNLGKTCPWLGKWQLEGERVQRERGEGQAEREEEQAERGQRHLEREEEQ